MPGGESREIRARRGRRGQGLVDGAHRVRSHVDEGAVKLTPCMLEAPPTGESRTATPADARSSRDPSAALGLRRSGRLEDGPADLDTVVAEVVLAQWAPDADHPLRDDRAERRVGAVDLLERAGMDGHGVLDPGQ